MPVFNLANDWRDIRFRETGSEVPDSLNDSKMQQGNQ